MSMDKRYEIVGLTQAEVQRCLEALGIPVPEDLTYHEITRTLFVAELPEDYEDAPI